MQDLVDSNGIERKSGEEWIIRKPGAYLPGVYETVVNRLKIEILDNFRAIILRAKQNYVDVYGIERKAGDEWLITNE